MTEKTNLVSRTLQIISVLKGRTLNGLTNGEIAKATKLPAATVTRILAVMCADGFAMQHDNSGRYSLSVRMLQIAQCHADEMSRATSKIEELNQRVHTGART
jgi:DNA-binding IclR family transcriptional regulator